MNGNESQHREGDWLKLAPTNLWSEKVRFQLRREELDKLRIGEKNKCWTGPFAFHSHLQFPPKRNKASLSAFHSSLYKISAFRHFLRSILPVSISITMFHSFPIIFKTPVPLLPAVIHRNSSIFSSSLSWPLLLPFASIPIQIHSLLDWFPPNSSIGCVQASAITAI